MAAQQISLDINIDRDGSAVKSADNVSTSIRGIGSAAKETHSSLTLMKRGFYAIGGIYIFTKMVKGAHEFERSLREINTLVKNGSQNMLSLRKGIEEFSIAFGQKPRDTAKATYQIISAGARGTIQTLERLRVAGQLAVGGVTTYAQAADLLTTVINAYSKSTLTAIQMSDILFTTVRLGKTTIRELGASMGTAAGMAASAGISFGDFNAMVATMTLSNPRTPRVMTQVRAMINNILNPRDQALVIAKRLKFDFTIEGIKDAGGFTKWMDDFIKKTQGSTQLASKFFTIRGLSGFIGLRNNWEKFHEIQQDTTRDFEGATQVAFDKVNQRTQVLAQANALLAREMNRAGDVIITVLAPSLEQIIIHYDKFKNVLLNVLVVLKTVHIFGGAASWLAEWVIKVGSVVLVWKLWLRQIVLTRIAMLAASRAGRIFLATMVVLKTAIKVFATFWYAYLPFLNFASIVIALALAWWYFHDKVSPLAGHVATLGDLAGVVFDLGGVREYATELEKLNKAAEEAGSPAKRWQTKYDENRANRPTKRNIFGIATPEEIQKSYRKLEKSRFQQAQLDGQSIFDGFGKKVSEILSASVSYFISDAKGSDIVSRDSLLGDLDTKIQKAALDGSSSFDHLSQHIQSTVSEGSSSFDGLGKTIQKITESDRLKLATLHPDLQAVITEARGIMNFKIIQGHRGEELQNKYYAEGRSQLQFPHSKHNQAASLAVDIAPLPNLFDSTQEEWDALAMVVKDTAERLRVNLTHGGDWPTLQDYAHFEIDISENWDRIARRIPEMPKTESLDKLDESIKKGKAYIDLRPPLINPEVTYRFNNPDPESDYTGINDYFSDTMASLNTGFGDAVSFVISDAHGGFDVIDAKITEVSKKGSLSFEALGKSIQKSTSYAILPSSLINPEIEQFFNDIGKIPKITEKSSSVRDNDLLPDWIKSPQLLDFFSDKTREKNKKTIAGLDYGSTATPASKGSGDGSMSYKLSDVLFTKFLFDDVDKRAQDIADARERSNPHSYINNRFATTDDDRFPDWVKNPQVLDFFSDETYRKNKKIIADLSKQTNTMDTLASKGGDGSMSYKLSDALLTKFLFDDVDKRAQAIADARERSNPHSYINNRFATSGGDEILPDWVKNPQIVEFFSDESHKKNKEIIAGLDYKDTSDETKPLAPMLAKLSEALFKKFLFDGIDEKVESLASSSERINPHSYLKNYGSVSKRGYRESNKAIASFFGGVSDFFQKTTDSVVAFAFSTNSDTKKILSDTSSLIIPDAHGAPSITPTPNPHSYLTQVQSTAAKGSAVRDNDLLPDWINSPQLLDFFSDKTREKNKKIIAGLDYGSTATPTSKGGDGSMSYKLSDALLTKFLFDDVDKRAQAIADARERSNPHSYIKDYRGVRDGDLFPDWVKNPQVLAFFSDETYKKNKKIITDLSKQTNTMDTLASKVSGDGSMAYKLSDALLTKFLFDDVDKRAQDIADARELSNPHNYINNRFATTGDDDRFPDWVKNPQVLDFFSDETYKKNKEIIAGLGYKDTSDETKPIVPMLAKLSGALFKKFLFDDIDEKVESLASARERSNPHSYLKNYGGESKGGYRESNKAIAAFFGDVFDFFNNTGQQIRSTVSDDDVKRIVKDATSFVISDAQAVPSKQNLSNYFSGLNTGIQSAAAKGQVSFNAFGNKIQAVAAQGSTSFNKLGKSIKALHANEFDVKPDVKTDAIIKKIEKAVEPQIKPDSFGTMLHQFFADVFMGVVDEPVRDGQFGLQDMLNIGRSLTKVELEKVGRDLTGQERKLQHDYKMAEENIKWRAFMDEQGGFFGALMAGTVLAFTSDRDRELADALAQQRDLEMQHAIANYDPTNLAKEATYIKEMVGRQKAADAQSEEGFAYNELVANKQLELAVMRMDPMRRKLELAAYESINEAKEGKTELSGIDSIKRVKTLRDLAFEKVWQEMATELNSNFIPARKTFNNRLAESEEMLAQNMISPRVYSANFQKIELDLQKNSFLGNRKRIEWDRDLIKGPNYIEERQQRRKQFDEDAVGRGFIYPARKSFVDENLYNFDLRKARDLRNTVRSEAEKFNEAASEYKLYFEQGQFDDNARTNLDIYTKLLKKLVQGTDSLTDAQKKNFNASVDRAAQGGAPGTGLALPEIENNALKRLEQLSQEEKLLSNLNSHQKDIKKQADDYIKDSLSSGRNLLPGDREGIRKQTASDHYRRAGDAASEEYKSSDQRLAEQIDYLKRLAAASDKFTDTMLDNEIAKAQLNTDSAYIDKLREENEAIGKNTFAYKANQASIEAVKSAKESRPGMSQTDLDEVGRVARFGVYNTEGEAVTSQYLSDAERINEELSKFNLLRASGTINEKEFKSAAMDTYNQYGLVLGNIDSLRAKIYGSIENSSSQLTDALVTGAQTSKDVFKDVATSIVDDILRMYIQAAITKPLMDALFAFSSYGFGFGTTTTLPATGGPQINTGNIAKDGGFVTAQGFAAGGAVDLSNLDKMGHVSGPGGSREDKILARLSNGEFVVNAESTRRYRGVLEEINSNAYASGGHVGKGASAGNYQSKGAAPNVNINVYNEAPGTEAEATAEDDGEGGIDVAVMVRTITNQIATDTAKGKGLAPVLQKRYKLNPAAGMR